MILVVLKAETEWKNPLTIYSYDPDCRMLYLAGKGDSNCRFFEMVDEAPYFHFLSQWSNNTPQKGRNSVLHVVLFLLTLGPSKFSLLSTQEQESSIIFES